MINDERVSNIWLFFIGLSAGLLACYFPRLMSLLTSVEKNIAIHLFTAEFVTTATVISIIIGISMIWFYANSEEQAKNVFVAALALPAVLSGGVNMSNLSTAATTDIEDLNSQALALQSHLEKILDIELVVLNDTNRRSLSIFSLKFPISVANAAEGQTATTNSRRSGIEIMVESLEQNYYILLESSRDKDHILGSLNKLKQLPLSKNARVYSQNNIHYLLSSGPQTKSNALIEAIELKTSFGYSPKLLQIN